MAAARRLRLGQRPVDQLELTDEHGAESLTRFRFAANDIGLVDRGYARYRDLRELMDVGAHPLMRMGWNALALRKPDGRPFEMFAALARLKKREGEVRVAVQPGAKLAAAPPLILRLVMRRKTSQEAEEAQKRLRKEAGKRGKKPDPRSLEAAKYILILTSLPRRLFPTRDVLSLYRLRWQIELAFKRFKSLAGLDRLPAKNPISRGLGFMQGSSPPSWPNVSPGMSRTLPPLDPARPPLRISRWRCVKIFLASVLAAIRGPLPWSTILKTFGRLRRLLCEPPRRRPAQSEYLRTCLC